jgi:hypothetical protein
VHTPERPSTTGSAPRAPSTIHRLPFSLPLPRPLRARTAASYIPSDHYANTSAQYAWLEETLAGVNRKKTPWIVVNT